MWIIGLHPNLNLTERRLAMYHVVSPAYGRDYKNPESLVEDWEGGKDFIYNGPEITGTYCSIRDFNPGDTIELRFNRLTHLYLYEMGY